MKNTVVHHNLTGKLCNYFCSLAANIAKGHQLNVLLCTLFFFFFLLHLHKESLGHFPMNQRKKKKSKDQKLDDCFGSSDPEAFRQNTVHYLTEEQVSGWSISIMCSLLHALESQFSFEKESLQLFCLPIQCGPSTFITKLAAQMPFDRL